MPALTERFRALHWIMLLVALALASSALVVRACVPRAPDSVRSLSRREQAALYARTLENLRMLCRTPASDVASYCTEEANVAQRLPQCDASCRELIAPFAVKPTR